MITRVLLYDAIEFEECQDNGVEGRKKKHVNLEIRCDMQDIRWYYSFFSVSSVTAAESWKL